MNPVNGNRLLPRTNYLKHTLYLTLEDMYNGTIRRLGVNRNVICDLCEGCGTKNVFEVEYDTCEECNGLGVLQEIRRTSLGIDERIERDCDLCFGKGEAIIFEDRCDKCRGRKTVPEQVILIVNVKQGTRHGQKIIYKDEGPQEPNMRPGNVVVILEALTHPTFSRQGDDLLMTMHLDLVESLCGFSKIITTLDKRHLSISSPRGKVVRNDDLKYLVDEGMPKYLNPNERGILIIEFKVNLPSSIRVKHVPTIEECLPPREKIDIPMEAVECNMVNMDPPEEGYYDENYATYEANPGDYIPDENYDQSYETHDQYEQENGLHYQYGSDEQYDQQGQYYQEDYEVQVNYEQASEYDQYDHNQQGYDSHTNNFQQEQVYQQEDCESLESYDATQQYRFND